jgi:protein required for attachment to host cells
MSTKTPENALIVIADGETVKLFKNTAHNNIEIESAGDMPLDYLEDKGPSTLPPETSDQERDEATLAKHIATDLYNRVHKGQFEHLVLVADPQTLGQIRPNLHDEVLKRLLLEIPKTLTNSTLDDIEKILKSQVA